MLLGGLQLQIKSGVVKPLGDTLIAGSGPAAATGGLPAACGRGTCRRGLRGLRVRPHGQESLALLNKPQLFLDGLSMLGYLKLNGIPLHYGWGVVEASGEGN